MKHKADFRFEGKEYAYVINFNHLSERCTRSSDDQLYSSVHLRGSLLLVQLRQYSVVTFSFSFVEDIRAQRVQFSPFHAVSKSSIFWSGMKKFNKGMSVIHVTLCDANQSVCLI